jgi:hypothetical protein
MAPIRHVNICGSAMSDILHMDIYYQNVRGLRIKQLDFYDVCSTDHNIICLTETWLNHLCHDHNLFPGYYTAFRSDRDCAKKTRGG